MFTENLSLQTFPSQKDIPVEKTYRELDYREAICQPDTF